MKKFYWLLFFLTLFMGSTTKANTIVNKSDKVIKILEDNLSSFYKENANKQALFCGDIDSILEGDREGLYSFYLRKTKNDVQEKFKEEYGDKIKLVKQDIFYTEYHKYNYSICLIEKDI